jgi:hypothetical protein
LSCCAKIAFVLNEKWKRKHAVVTTKCIQAEARDKSTRVRRNKRLTEIFCRVPKKQIAEKQAGERGDLKLK